jgi:hypothetical protein
MHDCKRGMRQMQFDSVQDESSSLCKRDLGSIEQPLHQLRCCFEPWRVSDKSHKKLAWQHMKDWQKIILIFVN